MNLFKPEKDLKMSEREIRNWIKTIFKKLLKKSDNQKAPTKKSSQQNSNTQIEKNHPWRLCHIGEHWVTDHPLWIPPTEKRPGYYTTRDGHCAVNPKKGKSKIIKDFLTAEEMQMIADKNFTNLTGPPQAGVLTEYVRPDDFDPFIRGWTKYWNDVLKPDIPLDPNLVKALIATESSFELKPIPPDAGSAGKAHGLIQLTDQAIKALSNPNGELPNHLIQITTENTSDPNLSISAGIRWLFRKRDLASVRLKRQATWIEAIAEYKSYLKDMVSGKDTHPTQMKKLDDIYRRLIK